MTGFPRGFGPDDLPPTGEAPAPELATSLRVGRDLDAFAAAERVEPRADFADRVMGAIAVEPAPRPVAVALDALRRGRPLALLAALGDAWRVAFSGGRPAAARAQALAFVLVAAIGIGSLGGLVGVGARALLNQPDSSPTPGPSPTLPTTSPSPTVSPMPSVSPGPSVSPSATPTPTSTRTPNATPKKTAEPTDTAEPTETAEPTDTDQPKTPRPSDHGGPGGGG
jgi:hypothetical protein